MKNDTPRLQSLDRRWEREAFGELDFADALARFESLWREAQELGVVPGTRWEGGLEPDLAMARALNDLPPA